MERYKIVRYYFKDYNPEVVKQGLTLEEVKAHCRNPETSSTTAKSPEAIIRTKHRGPWFEGYVHDNVRT